MRQLMAKDVRLVAPYLWLIVPAHALWCAQASLTPELYFWLSLAAALAFPVAVIVIEWHFDAERLIASLPVGRAAIVKARYGSALGVVALGGILYVVYGHLMTALGGERLAPRWPEDPAYASASGIAAFLGVGSLLVVGFLPFHFRFGPGLGGGLFAGATGLAITGGAALARLTCGGDPSPGVVVSMAPPSEIVRGWLASLAGAWGPGRAALGLGAGALLLGALSVWLSTRAYERREL